ncbi:hypothetical protein O3G_MSEX013718 [Manduca sexta]|uniref:Uncharacterized protein n=1 Tax=Manduca sexta TaxID=7130 RepID=A0A922CYD0_MANSE|nr:hypothetical protein O3G_MSEX013718 [Manduca sexta]
MTLGKSLMERMFHCREKTSTSKGLLWRLSFRLSSCKSCSRIRTGMPMKYSQLHFMPHGTQKRPRGAMPVCILDDAGYCIFICIVNILNLLYFVFFIVLFPCRLFIVQMYFYPASLQPSRKGIAFRRRGPCRPSNGPYHWRPLQALIEYIF